LVKATVEARASEPVRTLTGAGMPRPTGSNVGNNAGPWRYRRASGRISAAERRLRR
jgi:hypothetical protein